MPLACAAVFGCLSIYLFGPARDEMGVELTIMADLTRVAGATGRRGREGTILYRRQGGSDLGQLAHRRRLSAPGHALGCPNPASLGRSAALAALAGHVGRGFD